MPQSTFIRVILFIRIMASAWYLPENTQDTTCDTAWGAYCRELELEADAIAFMLTAGACFEPLAAIDVFQDLEAYEKLEYLRDSPELEANHTHPMPERRIAAVLQTIPGIQRAYLASGCAIKEATLRYMVSDVVDVHCEQAPDTFTSIRLHATPHGMHINEGLDLLKFVQA